MNLCPNGKYNIGMTAGIETTLCCSEWIEGCNRMDLIVGSSEHTSKSIKRLANSNKADQRTPNKL